MKHFTLSLAGSALLLSLAFSPVRAEAPPEFLQAEGGNLWFVELVGPPVADGARPATVRSEKAAFKRAAAAAGVAFTERRSFDVLFNGYSVEIDAANRAKLTGVTGVKALYPVELIHAPTPEQAAGSAADMATALAMTGANIAQDTLGFTGAGIKVGIIDTGIDIDHPDFGGSGVNGTTPFPTARIVAGWDFVGDDYDANPGNPTYNPVPVPGPNPDDCNGHGTHVAGIVAANGAVKGVAPEASLGAYRVFGCTGSSSADVIIAALERALADGMDVVNQSLGAAFQWPQYPTAQASDRLVNKGVVVVASIGNSGTSGLYAAGAPGVGKKVIGVASFDNTHVFLPYATVNGRDIGYIPLAFSPPAPTSGTSQIMDVGLACSALPAGSLTGKTALAARGTCAFADKAINAIAAGAEAVLISNNAAGVFSGTLGAPLADPRPVVGISQADGNFIRAQAAPVMIEWTDQQGSFPNPTGGLISGFSSYGLAADLSLKPNIGAPGGNIYSTYPLERGGYATLSGTSMSAPHVAGGVALVLQANPKIPAQAMAARLQNHADPKNWQGNAALGFLDQVHRQGAGMLDIAGTIQATATVEPGELALGESEAGPAVRTLTIENKGTEAVTYTLGHAPALNTNANTFSPGATTGFASATFSAPSVTVMANSSATVDVTITANPAVANRSLYGGYITLTPDDGSATMRVPYAGFKGDYQSIQVLTPTANNFPRLGWTPNGVNFGFAGAGDVFTLAGFDIPYVLLHLDHHSRRLRLEAFDAVTGGSVGRISNDEYWPRNSTATGFFAFAWNGDTFRGNGRNANQWSTAPNGDYVMKLSVLKALGDENDPSHWETWTSPMFTIARP
jgi:minor extracellular serine protease Vpr